ncbi:hypothetical protein JIQ42_07261 [Leishmania sp. Namibia]|uniref:hypothetical protein n=1 Tax=Leishmania sp. Namibia TaxID=2802991 RepID=UPI001B401DC8|nr:hypothetical protein JIQ42_07261 [Leishmania sp. Namibia]
MYTRPLDSGRLRGGRAGNRAGRQVARLCAAALLVSTAVACVVLCSAPWVLAGTAGGDELEPVYLLNAMYSTGELTKEDAKALWKGMDMAFYNSEYKAAGGRPIKILDPDEKDKHDIVQAILNALKKQEKLLAVLGPYLDVRLSAALGNADVVKSELMLMAPFTGSSGVRTWNPSVYFTRAEPMVELKSVIMHAINTLRARRVAFMYLSDTHFGDVELDYMQKKLESMLRDPAAVYTAPFSDVDVEVNQGTFDAMANTRPQVIIVWAAPSEQVLRFLEKALTDSRMSSAYVISCSMLQRVMFDVYKRLLGAGRIPLRDGHIIASLTSSTVSDLRWKYTRMFKEQMSNYIENSGSFDYWPDDEASEAPARNGRSAAPYRGYTVDTFFLEHPSLAQLMGIGWLSGTLVQQTLERSDWIVSRSMYRAGLFNQSRFIIGGDFVLGDYGGPCEPLAQLLGAVCYCNQGGHSAVLTGLRGLTWGTVSGTIFSYAQSECSSLGSEILTSVSVLTLLPQDYPKLVEAGTQIKGIASGASNNMLCKGRIVKMFSLDVMAETVQALFDVEVADYTVDVVAGPMVPLLDAREIFVVSPLYPVPYLLTKKMNYVYLMPTLEQEMYVLYSNINAVSTAASVSKSVNVVLRGYSADEVGAISEVLFKTAASFDVPDPSIVRAAFTDSLSGVAARRGINLVIGMSDGDGASMADFLAANPGAAIVVCFDDLAMHYKELVEAFSVRPTSVQSRLMSFNSLPLWSDNSAEAEAASPLLAIFHSLYPDSASHTPSLLRDLVTVSFIQELAVTLDVVNSKMLAESVYINSVFTVHGLPLGPFYWDCTATASGDLCLYANYGSSSIAILSMQRMLDPKVPRVSPPSTPSMVYRPRSRSDALTPAQRNAIIIGSIVGTVAMIAGCAMLVYYCIDSRDNDAAPKDGDEPVTLIFTDIESSTALWAALPQLMTDAVAAHHRLIRQLIKKYKCYEVKTIGDSFMIACKEAHSAVCLAREIQTRLLGHDWGTECIDGAYCEFELGHVDTVDDYEPPTARLSEEEYAALWRGLRVRVGIHTGLSDIRYDEVTKGYDYYGDTSNMAARTEAVANGGQVIATETTWWALSNDERAAAAHTVMGPQGLRGVPFAVEMFQLNAVPGRRHAALRTEVEAILPDEAATETGSSGAGALLSSVGTMAGPAAGFALMLSSCFVPYPVAQRVRELQPLLSKWGVGAPPRSRLVSEEDYCQGLVNRLAIRIATVTQARQRMGNNGAAGTGDVHGIGACGVLNPFMGEGGSVSDGAKSRHSGVAASQRSAEPSAMRESRILRRSLSGQPQLTMVPVEGGSVDAARLHDDVMPFASQASRRASEELDAQSVSASMSGEVVVVRMPRSVGWRRRSNAVGPTSEKGADEAKSGGGGAHRPQLWGW